MTALPTGAVATVLGATAMVVIGAASINTALPSLVRALNTEPATVVRVVTGYQAAMAMALLPCAALGESLGLRRVFAAGVALFTVASMAGAFAPSFHLLVASRFAQGIGGAAILALGVASTREALPCHRLAAAISWNALTVAVSSAAAPMLGAALLSMGGWRWLFLINLPIGAGLLLAMRALPATKGSRQKIDLVAIGLNALIFGCLVAGGDAASKRPLLAAGYLLAALMALVLLVRRELPKASPLVPLDLLRIAAIRRSAIASVCCFAGQTAGLVALPFLLSQTLGASPWRIGLWMTSWPLAVAAVAPMAGRLADRLPAGAVCAAGGALLSAGLASMAARPTENAAWPLAGCGIVCGLGWGLFQIANNRNMYLCAPLPRSAAAGGMQGTARLTGQIAGAMIMTVVFGSAEADAAPRMGVAIGALLTLTAATLSAWPRSGGPIALSRPSF